METLKKHLLSSGGKANETNTSKSKFFLDINKVSFMHHIINGYEGVVEYVDTWKKFDGAGTHLIDSLMNAVKGTCYENLGQETSNAFKSIFSSSTGSDLSGKLREMENLLLCLKNHLEGGNENDRCQSNLQILCRCFLLFLKVQLDYHQMCSASILSLLEVLSHSYEYSENKDVLLQMSNLDMIPVSPRQSPSHNSRKKQTQCSQAPKQNTLKSSFLSLFEKKTPVEQSNSSAAFYVDLNKSETSSPKIVGTLSNDPAVGNTPQPNESSVNTQVNNEEDILVQIGLDPGESTEETRSNISPVLTTGLHTDIQSNNKTPLASVEEIDSVINLLSGCGAPSKYMETIHENRLTVPVIHTSRTPSSASSIEDIKPYKIQPQQHAEGFIDFSCVGGTGPNAWTHRSSLPSFAISRQMNSQNMMEYGGTLPRRFSHEINRPNAISFSQQPPTSILNQSSWAYPDFKHGNRTWPMNNVASQGTGSWSNIQDSDDLSDDSSCGEQFFAVGLDLVHALDSKNGSSDEESDKKSQYKDEKVEDTIGTNAWSPKPVWAVPNQSTPVYPSDQSNIPSHRPLSMQRSDPLSNKNVWSASGSLNMSGYGHLQ